MRRSFQSLIVSLLIISSFLWACDQQRVADDEPVNQDVSSIPIETGQEYRCGDQIVFFTSHGSDKGDLKIANTTYAMEHVVSASGAKYENLGDETTVFWSKGDTAFVTVKGEDLPECVKAKKESAAEMKAKAPQDIRNVSWILEDLNKTGIIDNTHVTLILDDNGRLSGNSGCNRYTGGYELRGDVLNVAPNVASTRMACRAPAVMQQEQKYLELLIRMKKATRTETGGLLLTADDGSSLSFMPED